MSREAGLGASGDDELRLRALESFVAAYEAEHGEITNDEMTLAAERARGRAILVRGARRSGPRRSSP